MLPMDIPFKTKFLIWSVERRQFLIMANNFNEWWDRKSSTVKQPTTTNSSVSCTSPHTICEQQFTTIRSSNILHRATTQESYNTAVSLLICNVLTSHFTWYWSVHSQIIFNIQWCFLPILLCWYVILVILCSYFHLQFGSLGSIVMIFSCTKITITWKENTVILCFILFFIWVCINLSIYLFSSHWIVILPQYSVVIGNNNFKACKI